MDTTIRVDNFRSVRSATFNISPGLNVLVGSNGSGKTNLLQSLRVLSQTITSGAALAIGRAGGPKRNFRRNEREIRFVIVGPYEQARYKGAHRQFLTRWEICISLSDPDQIVQISSENLSVLATMGRDSFERVIEIDISRHQGKAKGQSNFVSSEELTRKMIGRDWVRSNSNKDSSFKQVKERVADVLKDVARFPQDASIVPHVASIHESFKRLLRDISSLDEYNIQPELARPATDPLPVTVMGNDGAGVSEVIHALETNQFRRFISPHHYYDSSSYSPGVNYSTFVALRRSNPLSDIIDNLKAGVSAIDDLTTEIDALTGRRYLVFHSDGEKYRPEEVSDGTMKWLCLLVALFVPRSRVILLEEPENFMHPWMQQRLVALAREQSKKVGSSVIMSSHSATIINSILVDELLIVHQQDGSTQVRNVVDQVAVREILDSSNFGLGDIWVSGGIGGVTGAG